MGKILTPFVLAAVALLLADSPVSAASDIVCRRFADFAVANAQDVRQIKGGCGLALNDVSLSLDRNAQINWCLSVRDETVELRKAELTEQTTKCTYCRNYGNQMAYYANYNNDHSCGYSAASGDPRWVTDPEFHVAGCMAIQPSCYTDPGTAYMWGLIPIGNAFTCGTRFALPDLKPIIEDVTQRMEACSPIGTIQQPLSYSGFVSKLVERMRQRRAEERAAQARERMLIGGGSRSDVVESYSEAKAKAREAELIAGSRSEMVEPYLSQKEIPSGGAGGSETPTAVVPSGGGTADAPRVVSAPASGGAGGSQGTVWGAQPAFEWKLGPDPTAVPSGGAGGSETPTAVVPSGGGTADAPRVVSAPASGGAGGSQGTVWGAQPAFEWKLGPDPTAVPSGGAGGSATPTAVVSSGGGTADAPRVGSSPASGGAGGSLNASSSGTATAVQVPQPPQQARLNDPKTVDNAQLKALLADPQIRARVTSLIAEEPSPRKSKKDQNLRAKRGRAPTDADRARPNSGMSPEAANAISTIIGVGLGVGLNNIGRRGNYSAAPGRGSSAAAPRRGTFDGPLR